MIHLEVQLITVQDATCRVNFKQFEPWAWSADAPALMPMLMTKQVVPWSFYKHNVNFQPTSGDTNQQKYESNRNGKNSIRHQQSIGKTRHNPHVSIRLHTTPLCYMSQVSRVSPFHRFTDIFFKSPEEVSRHLVISRARQWLPTGSHW